MDNKQMFLYSFHISQYLGWIIYYHSCKTLQDTSDTNMLKAKNLHIKYYYAKKYKNVDVKLFIYNILSYILYCIPTHSGWVRTFPACTVSVWHWTHSTLKHKFLIPNVTWAICPLLIRHGWAELESQTFAPIIPILRWLVISFNWAKCRETSLLNSAIFSFRLQQEAHGPLLYLCLNEV